jgi:hypothetical protein
MTDNPHRTLYSLTEHLCLLGLVLDWLLFAAVSVLLVLRAVAGSSLLPLLLIPLGLLVASWSTRCWQTPSPSPGSATRRAPAGARLSRKATTSGPGETGGRHAAAAPGYSDGWDACVGSPNFPAFGGH